MFKPKMEACWDCPNIYGCEYEGYKNCYKIEIAADGLGIPFKPKKELTWFEKVPFGVHQSLKRLIKVINETIGG